MSPKNAYCLKISCCRCRPHRVTQHVHYGSNRGGAGASRLLVHIAVADSLEETKEARPRLGRQYGSHNVLAGIHALAVEQSKEKCFVLDDRATVASRELFPVVPGWSRADTVAIPRIRIERGVLNV